MITVSGIFVGQPGEHRDQKGSWTSAIYREPVAGAIALGVRGLEGDRVADSRHHGRPDQAVCCHFASHYEHWNEVYGLSGARRLGPGSVGENWTLEGATESTVCAGDLYAVEDALVRVTGPRMPCWKQERKLGLPDFERRSVEAMLTGFYLAVEAAGTVRAGAMLRLVDRPSPEITLRRINEAYYRGFDRAEIERLLASPVVPENWKRSLAKRLERGAANE
jgi:MOSC domain-containing protein YiiM